MIKLANGEPTIGDGDAPASTEFAFNDVVTRDSNGRLAKATASTPRSELHGLIQVTITSSDSDYAKVKTVPVLRFTDDVEFEADVDTGTLTAAMRGRRFDLADHNGIDVTSEGQKAVEITRFLSATKARVKFITSGDKARLVSYSQHVTLADFTDGGSTIGTVALGITIPAGAVYAQTLLRNLTGTVGESTATIQVGEPTGGDVDRYSTGTPSVAADAAAGVDLGVPSGTKFHAAAIVPTIHVTEDDDFTDITDGLEFDITLFWFEAD